MIKTDKQDRLPNVHFGNIDAAFAGMIERICDNEAPWVALVAGLVSHAATNGHVCLNLEMLVEEGLPSDDPNRQIPLDITLEQLRQILLQSIAVGGAGDEKPLILEGNMIYLQRYWNYEGLVVKAIKKGVGSAGLETDSIEAQQMLTRLFTHSDKDQIRAIQSAVSQRFTVISGGPGTGKTTTIAKIIMALYQRAAGDIPRILLAAPTGKAAARMQTALDLGLEDLMKNHHYRLPGENPTARTLHRLLGVLPGKVQCRYGKDRPLPADVVIVDEASMIDLALMAKLVQAISDTTKLILVGDKDQLASVEAGSVMGDICAGLSSGPAKDSAETAKKEPIGGQLSHLVVLQKNYRFSSDSGISDLGRAVNAGDGHLALDLLEDPQKQNIYFRSISHTQDVKSALMEVVRAAIAPAFENNDPHTALEQLNQIKILSPVRKGQFGVTAINQFVENCLRQMNLIDNRPQWGANWYPGRPVMINRNDYHHQLYNGDMGITVIEKTGDRRQVRVCIADNDGRMRKLFPEQLPEYETVYAMSVHKSQGTEFEKVILILPDRDVPLLTRELIYTAVTRARQNVEVWGDRDILNSAIGRRIRRTSGLSEKLKRLQCFGL